MCHLRNQPIPEEKWLTTSFLLLAVLFLITGGVYYGVNHTPGAPATVVLVAICHFAFNFAYAPGPLPLPLPPPPFSYTFVAGYLPLTTSL